jgi:hypothetical protein
MATKARLRKRPNSLRRGAGCAWRERQAKGREGLRSAPIGELRRAWNARGRLRS